jgi:hypothetical protein
MSEPNIEPASREVIAGKLLAALDDGSGQVAIVLREVDLDRLILAMESYRYGDADDWRFIADLKRLRKEAFGE